MQTPKITRRDALRGASAALTLAAAKAAFPGGAFAQSAEPETKTVKLGYIALTDAAALII
jgi:nitrate/nitrite transport system substrate-binding protein